MKQNSRELIVVCPVYNEPAASLFALAQEWEAVLDGLVGDWEWRFIDDGSSAEDTLAALRRIAADRPRFTVHRTANQGHGQACLLGYRLVRPLARWILQIDSDGQCRVSDFPALWAARRPEFHQFGVRVIRDDGRLRRWISAGIRMYLWAVTGVLHPDSNCPFRILYADRLEGALDDIPYALANMALALKIAGRSRFTRIGFAKRRQGASTHRFLRSLKNLLELRGLELGSETAAIRIMTVGIPRSPRP
jgi:glycosyltransferase involved in cell wall biosynthesis